MHRRGGGICVLSDILIRTGLKINIESAVKSEDIYPYLTLIFPYIINIIRNYEQQDAKFLDLFISTDALHVSGVSFSHHQENKTVYAASGIVNSNGRIK